MIEGKESQLIFFFYSKEKSNTYWLPKKIRKPISEVIQDTQEKPFFHTKSAAEVAIVVGQILIEVVGHEPLVIRKMIPFFVGEPRYFCHEG